MYGNLGSHNDDSRKQLRVTSDTDNKEDGSILLEIGQDIKESQKNQIMNEVYQYLQQNIVEDWDGSNISDKQVKIFYQAIKNEDELLTSLGYVRSKSRIGFYVSLRFLEPEEQMYIGRIKYFLRIDLGEFIHRIAVMSLWKMRCKDAAYQSMVRENID
eukprot:TRINITY_DN2242_c0_g1_i5.p3 TRINITY_DN2242_c0_g1~~TRINITY_DN2242_c0_g1_i5.p3  ORF type:complete len:158 (-),score=18.62 TRINITY_DN2242_c0_g1_i5:22-495(-)